jgi:hypothetical protein
MNLRKGYKDEREAILGRSLLLKAFQRRFTIQLSRKKRWKKNLMRVS